jgi:hypothetical protein
VWSRVKGRGCPYCAGVKPVVGVTDFATKMPELLQEWDYERNKDINLQDYMPSSRAIVWWKCKICNYKWEDAIGARSRERCRCPKCAGKIKE